jgi:tetratricopeptide (TPR) repeat protein
MLEASVARYLFESTGDAAYRQRAEEVIAAARAQAPDDPRTLRAAAELALALGDLDGAEQSLERLLRVDPTSGVWSSLYGRLAERRGSFDVALGHLRRIAGERPSWWNLLALAKIERLGGEVTAARRHLEEARVRAPSNIAIKAESAYVEMYWGDPETALDLYLEVVSTAPAPHYLASTGALQLMLGRFEEAMRTLERAEAAGSHAAPTLLNLADCHLLSGDLETAGRYYRSALAAFESLPRDLTPEERGMQAQCLAQLGSGQEAERVLAEATGSAKPTPALCFDAALVNALLGNTVEARQWAGRAVSAGMSPRYFELPWFDSMRAHSEASSPATPDAR